MSDDTTKNLPDGDRLDTLIGLVKVMGVSLQDVKADVQSVKGRLETLEKTVAERLYDTRPIWERALAEIAGARSELAETRTEMRDGFHNLGRKIKQLIEDVFTVRTENERLERRLDNLESKTS